MKPDESVLDKRIQWIDIGKGLCIVSMVMGHAGSPYTTYIYLFHMCAFLILSGITYHGEKYTLLQFVRKKFITLVVPYYLISFIYILICTCLQHVSQGEYFFNHIIRFIERVRLLFSVRPSPPEIAGPMWFLLVLFEAEILCRIVYEICIHIVKNRNLPYCLCIIVGVIGFCITKGKPYLPFDIDLGIFACMFVAIGILISNNNILSIIPPKNGILIATILSVFFGNSDNQ